MTANYGAGKPWTMSSAIKEAEPNIAPTIVHENAHLIGFEKDPMSRGERAPKFEEILSRNGLTVWDAPTRYGESNNDEFWCETFAAYVHANAWLKKKHPKVYKAFEETLEAYGIDKATIATY
jgi:hypothetical protein